MKAKAYNKYFLKKLVDCPNFRYDILQILYRCSSKRELETRIASFTSALLSGTMGATYDKKICKFGAMQMQIAELEQWTWGYNVSMSYLQNIFS